MKKKLDTASITNELEQSTFFKGREKISPPTPETETRKTDQSTNQKLSVRAYTRTGDASVRPNDLVSLIPPVPVKRRPERYAFQFWEDQITRLKQLRKVVNLTRDAEYNRSDLTLSDMMREALDDYIDKQIKLLKKSVRTDE